MTHLNRSPRFGRGLRCPAVATPVDFVNEIFLQVSKFKKINKWITLRIESLDCCCWMVSWLWAWRPSSLLDCWYHHRCNRRYAANRKSVARDFKREERKKKMDEITIKTSIRATILSLSDAPE